MVRDSEIATLLLTGANNHDWERSAPFCREVLESTGAFDVDVTEDPDIVLSNYDEERDYDLFFIDYNGPEWSDSAKENFEGAVANGTGVTILHAANNPFPGWEAYEEMVGLLWRDNAGHGSYHEFTVEFTDTDHPIADGMEDFDIWDELYHGLSNPQDVDYEVLATAHSDPETGGTGQDEPVVLVLRYGEGRVYHHALGHVWPGDPEEDKGSTMTTFENEPFQELLARGSTWAATGDTAGF
ncbi:ThuA domain-containing protein [Halosimplex amylolyticum]|uniref:ThuA domain-containing protein n=1 Tax=Halosimplex amylolyticum TaxID=3396616 RepID=UPI003F57EDFF